MHILPANSLGITLFVKNILTRNCPDMSLKTPSFVAANMAGNDSDIPQNIPSFWQQTVQTLVKNIWICFHWHSWKFSRRLTKYILFSFADIPGVSLKIHRFHCKLFRCLIKYIRICCLTRLEIAKIIWWCHVYKSWSGVTFPPGNWAASYRVWFFMSLLVNCL